MKNQTKQTTLSARVCLDTRERVSAIARKLEHTESWVVDKALKIALPKLEKLRPFLFAEFRRFSLSS